MNTATSLSDWDINFDEGNEAADWVQVMLKTDHPTVEVKAPKLFLKPDEKHGKRQLAYIEYSAIKGGTWTDSGITVTRATAWALTFGDLPGMLFVDTDWLKRAARLAFKRGQLAENRHPPNPTKGVLVGLDELWETRPDAAVAG